ncbi:MAG: leucine-rich repeat domain-containing protein, partial [Oscillospiraceae bacterium]|nr:leucine-rich repeat domain-containing protein [Oscillospiraceae bacterium]
MKKRILSLILAFALLCAFAPTISFASTVASGECGVNGDNLTWTLDSDGTLTISGTGVMDKYYGSDLAPWHDYADSVKKAVIKKGVTEIGQDAFLDCTSMTGVNIADSVTSINAGAFYNCTSLSSITLPDGITTISDRMFYYCSSLTRIKIPSGVTSIGQSAFDKCNLTSINIPASVQTIGDTAIRRNYNLKEAKIYSKTVEFGNDVFGSSDDSFAIIGYKNSTAETYANDSEHWFLTFKYYKYSYTFLNTKSSFGFDENKKWIIPKEIYLKFGYSQKHVDNLGTSSRVMNGRCFGISASSILFYKDILSAKSYDSSASFPRNLAAPTSESTADTKFRSMIDLFQVIASYSTGIDNLEKFSELPFNAVNVAKELDNGNPVIFLCATQNGTHAMVLYDYTLKDDIYTFYLYDSNQCANSFMYVDSNTYEFMYTSRATS